MALDSAWVVAECMETLSDELYGDGPHNYTREQQSQEAHFAANASSAETSELVKGLTEDVPNKCALWVDISAGVILLFLLAQLILCARAKSATFDEQFHITRGLTYLRTGDLRLMREHPPLIEILLALPLALDETVILPLSDPSWQLGDKHTFSDLVLWRINPDGPSIILRGRMAVIALTIILGLTIWVWSRKMFGPLPALLSVTVFAFDPNVLAHGCLATNDLGLTLFATLTVFTFWLLLQQPSWARAVVCGIALGLALASKLSAIFLFPALAAIAFADHLLVYRKDRLRVRPLSSHFCLVALIAGLTLWAVYGFEVGSWRGFLVPASAYLNGLQGLANRFETGTQSFLLGSYSSTGWWYYFPIALSVKTPLPTLSLVGAAVVYAFRQSKLRRSIPLLIPVLVYICLCCVSGLNIGYRHLLPILPFTFIFIGQLAQTSWRLGPRYALAIGVLLGWLIVGTLTISPHYLAYFNELAGGPDGGYRVLADSNIDWGQDLPGLYEYMRDHNIDTVKLAYCGTSDPAAYGINYELLPGIPKQWWKSSSDPEVLVDPGPGVYAISATILQGVRFQNHDVYAWFRARQPDAVIGHSIFIYRVP